MYQQTSRREAGPAESEVGVAGRITLISFGFKYGHPNTNHFFDVSFLKNPAREPRWGLFSQPSPEMRRWVLEQPGAQAFLERVVPLIQTLMELDDDLRIGFGCSSGRHRSAILTEEVRRRLEAHHVSVKLVHREESYQ